MKNLLVVILAVAVVVAVVGSVAAYAGFQSPVAQAQADVMRIDAVDRLEANAQTRAQQNLVFALDYQMMVVEQTRKIESQIAGDATLEKMSDAFWLIWTLVLVAAAGFVFSKLGLVKSK